MDEFDVLEMLGCVAECAVVCYAALGEGYEGVCCCGWDAEAKRVRKRRELDGNSDILRDGCANWFQRPPRRLRNAMGLKRRVRRSLETVGGKL